MLRQDLLEELNGTRRELGEQLALVRGLVEAAQVAKTAGAKSSRASGPPTRTKPWRCATTIVTAAGDLFEATGGQPGAGHHPTNRRRCRRPCRRPSPVRPARCGSSWRRSHRSRPMTAKRPAGRDRQRVPSPRCRRRARARPDTALRCPVAECSPGWTPAPTSSAARRAGERGADVPAAQRAGRDVDGPAGRRL